MHTEGRYIGCVYFSLEMVDQSIVPGDDVIEKGTDAEDSVEIYTTVEDAENIVPIGFLMIRPG